MARMTVAQAVSAILAINTAITVEAIKAVLMNCDKWTMVRVYEEMEKTSWGKDTSHTLKADLAEKIADYLRDGIERTEFVGMTVKEKYIALITRGYDYATRRVEDCTERDYDEIGLMLGVKFTRQHTPLHRWNMLLDAIEKFQAGETAQAETVANKTPAVENEPTLEKISQTAEKYFASEMTANEVEAVMKEANVETLREFATQREILIEDDEDHAGLVKIVMEDLVCEKLGVYEEEPNDGETYAESEEPDPLAPVIEEVKKATTANAIVNALMTCTPREMLNVCTELTGIKHVMGGMLPKKHTAETVATVLMAHRLSLKIESMIEANAGKKDVESELRECPYAMHRWLMRWAGIKLEGEMPREVIVKRLASYYFSK